MTRRIASIERDGFTVCVNDTEGAGHCWRIDKDIGAELVTRVTSQPMLVEALLGVLRVADRATDEFDAARAALAAAGVTP